MTIFMTRFLFEKIKQNTINRYGEEKTNELLKKLNIKFIGE